MNVCTCSPAQPMYECEKYRANLCTSRNETAILREESSNELQTLIKEGTVVLSCFARYVDFCATVNIPAFPISFSSISLFLIAKYSFNSGNFYSVYLNLCRSKAAIHESWEGVVGYDDLEDGSEIEQGLKEFMSKMKAHARGSSNFTVSIRVLERER